VSSGTCQSNNRYEVPQADCETAATSLGLDFYGYDRSDYCDDCPPGCIFISDYNVLNFNTLSTSLSCGSEDSHFGDAYDCICGELGTGDVSPDLSVLDCFVSVYVPCTLNVL
jgi:hypothetical protein